MTIEEKLKMQKPIFGKKYKGTTIIELKDKNGKVERYSKDNIVTNAVSNIFANLPFGRIDTLRGTDSNFLFMFDNPRCFKNFFGGILLFSDHITEDVNTTKIPAGKKPMAWAGDYANTTRNIHRGSPNLTETGPLADGYKFVWDFATDEANGTIGCLCLTNSKFGNMDGIAQQLISEVGNVHYLHVVSADSTNRFGNNISKKCATDMFLGFPSYDKNTGRIYHIQWTGNNTLTLSVFENNVSKSSLLYTDDAAPYRTILDSHPINLPFIVGSNNDNKAISYRYDNGIIYLTYVQNNTNYIQLAKINVSDLNNITITSEQKTYSGATFGINKTNPGGGAGAAAQRSNENTIPIHKIGTNLYMYLPKYNSDPVSMFKININDTTDISEINPDSSVPTGLNPYKEKLNFYSGASFYSIYEDDSDIVQICDATASEYIVWTIWGDTLSYTFSTENTDKTNACMGGYIKTGDFTYYGAGHFYERTAIDRKYLATINNIEPVVKTSDKTMKITYILKEIDE